MANTLFNKVEGRITYASPISSFFYKNGSPEYAQHFILTDVIKTGNIENGNNEKILNFKIVVWNDLVSLNLLKVNSFYIIFKLQHQRNRAKQKIIRHQSI